MIKSQNIVSIQDLQIIAINYFTEASKIHYQMYVTAVVFVKRIKIG